jgi:hypothetical protein
LRISLVTPGCCKTRNGSVSIILCFVSIGLSKEFLKGTRQN